MSKKRKSVCLIATRMACAAALVLLSSSTGTAQSRRTTAPLRISNNDRISQEIELVYYIDSSGRKHQVNYRWRISPRSTSRLLDPDGRVIHAAEIGFRPYGMPGDLLWVANASKSRDRSGYLYVGFTQRDVISLLKANQSRPQTAAQRERTQAINAARLRDANRRLRSSQRTLEDMQRWTRENNRNPLNSSY